MSDNEHRVLHLKIACVDEDQAKTIHEQISKSMWDHDKCGIISWSIAPMNEEERVVAVEQMELFE